MTRGPAIAVGTLAGSLIGAVSRPAVVYTFWLRDANADMVQVLVPVSAAIGLIVGVAAVLLAVLVRGRWMSALVGACLGGGLAYLFAILTFLPLFWGGLFGFGDLKPLDDEAPIYGYLLALTGVLSGGGGALLAERLARRPSRI
jgi:hypothetical protein